MKNAWKVIWVENGKKKKKVFEGDQYWAEHRGIDHHEKPLEVAVFFAKELRNLGLTPELISSRKAFIQRKEQTHPPNPGMVWCPYCVKWRHFQLSRIQRKSYIGVPAMRCPTCTISEEDYYVKRYNGKLEKLSSQEVRRMYDAERRTKRGS